MLSDPVTPVARAARGSRTEQVRGLLSACLQLVLAALGVNVRSGSVTLWE